MKNMENAQKLKREKNSHLIPPFKVTTVNTCKLFSSAQLVLCLKIFLSGF